MEHRPPQPTAKGPASTFTGDVYVTTITSGDAPSQLTAALVRFTPGARSHWHSHDVGQTLHGVEGVGLVGTRDGRVVPIRPGETVWTPPGEEHWHGASSDAFMAHLALLESNPDGANPNHWLEAVTGEQYEAALQALTHLEQP